MSPASRPTEGYQASQPEFAWLRAKAEPPPRSLVWLGYWDCQKAMPVRYAPSSAPLPTPDGSRVEGHLATFTLGFVAFQVFTVDYVAADQHNAALWNTCAPSPRGPSAVSHLATAPEAAEGLLAPASLRHGRLGPARNLGRRSSHRNGRQPYRAAVGQPSLTERP